VSDQLLFAKQEQIQEERLEQRVLLGKPLRRKEDPRLLTGTSKYVDDIKLPGVLYGAVLRSSYAHAILKRIDPSDALALPGVKLILTSKDLLEFGSSLPVEETDNGEKIKRPILASDEVSYVGEPIAFAVAETRQLAEDALELISVEYEPLPPVVDPLDAIRDDSPKAHIGLKSNTVRVAKSANGDVEGAFKRASKIISVEYLNQRLAPSPLEPRASLAYYDKGAQLLNIWISTQGPFQVRSDLSEILKIPENKIRVIAPEVGGGFGAKLSTYSEELLVSISSMMLGLPVKWVESRSENFISMTHGRGQIQKVELAANERGRILGMKVKLIGDAGAYLTEGSSDATFTLKMSTGPYNIPAWEGEAHIVLTNKVPHDAYRGASRPEATYLIERAIDELATALGLDPAEIRLRNFIPKEDFPHKVITDEAIEFDSGDYAMNLKRALELSHYDRWRDEQKRARENGRLIGIGLSTYVEICAFGPDFPETAAMSVSRSGKVTVISGTSPHGQGHETPFSQIVADILGIPMDDIYVVYGDTAQLPWGTFTAGSRSAALGGSAVLMCAEKIKSKMKMIASFNLGIEQDEDIVFQDGYIFSRKEPEKKKASFSKIASYAYRPGKLPPGMEPVLYAFSAFAPKNYTFPFGTHVAVVEVNKETGKVTVLDYVSVDDCGKVLNPMIVEGQLHGGITQGLGQALLEGVQYDSNGTLLTSSFLDYQIPLAEDVPNYHCFRTETVTDSNALGIKGIGEAGTIAATPAIANAVNDALSPLGIRVRDMPLTPSYIKSLIDQALRKN
jgi:carbon-monoxide dehydrogenase large subunit